MKTKPNTNSDQYLPALVLGQEYLVALKADHAELMTLTGKTPRSLRFRGADTVAEGVWIYRADIVCMAAKKDTQDAGIVGLQFSTTKGRVA